HVRLHGHPERAAAAQSHRRRLARRGLHARSPGRMDGLPDVLRIRRPAAARRNGAAYATIYPYGPFEAGDGKVVMLGLQNEREWKLFCDKVLRRPELSADPRFDANMRRVENRAA